MTDSSMNIFSFDKNANISEIQAKTKKLKMINTMRAEGLFKMVCLDKK